MTTLTAAAPAAPVHDADDAGDFFAPLLARAGDLEKRYAEQTPASLAAFARAKRVFPGGYTR
jgi:hypothetical protein